MTSQPKIESQLQLEAEGSQKDRLAWSDAPAGCSPIPAGTPRVGEAGGRRWWLARSMDWAARPGWALGCGEQSGGVAKWQWGLSEQGWGEDGAKTQARANMSVLLGVQQDKIS